MLKLTLADFLPVFVIAFNIALSQSTLSEYSQCSNFNDTVAEWQNKLIELEGNNTNLTELLKRDREIILDLRRRYGGDQEDQLLPNLRDLEKSNNESLLYLQTQLQTIQDLRGQLNISSENGEHNRAGRAKHPDMKNTDLMMSPVTGRQPVQNLGREYNTTQEQNNTSENDGPNCTATTIAMETSGTGLLMALDTEPELVQNFSREINATKELSQIGPGEEDKLNSTLEMNNTDLLTSLGTERELVQNLSRETNAAKEFNQITTTVREINTLEFPGLGVRGVARGNDSIFVFAENSSSGIRQIHIFEDGGNFTLRGNVSIGRFKGVNDMSYCNVSSSLFVREDHQQCVWKLHVSKPLSAKWLNTTNSYRRLMVTSDGKIILLNETQLDIYVSNATYIKSIPLFFHASIDSHAVQTHSGTYLISHRKSDADMFVISEIGADGEFIKQFPANDSSFWFAYLSDFYVDPVEHRIFAADFNETNHRVIVISSDFKRHKVLVDTVDIKTGPMRLHYSQTDGQLIVGMRALNLVRIYEVI